MENEQKKSPLTCEIKFIGNKQDASSFHRMQKNLTFELTFLTKNIILVHNTTYHRIWLKGSLTPEVEFINN